MTTFVLIHGGVHAGWCWSPLVTALAERGHRSIAVDLPGHGGDTASASTATLADYIDAVGDAAAGALAIDGDPPVLVGHSMGGLAVAGVAERMPSVVADAVFLSAIVPADGGAGLPTLQQAAGESALLEEGVLAFSADQTTISIDPARAADVFYNRCRPEDIEWAVPQLGPEPVAPMVTPMALSAAGLGSVPRHYLGGTDDRCVPPALQRAISDRWGMHYSPIDADHTPFLSMTAELAERLAVIGQG